MTEYYGSNITSSVLSLVDPFQNFRKHVLIIIDLIHLILYLSAQGLPWQTRFTITCVEFERFQQVFNFTLHFIPSIKVLES